MSKPVVIRLRVLLDRELYDLARSRGYTREDIAQAIQQAGLEELTVLVKEGTEPDDPCMTARDFF